MRAGVQLVCSSLIVCAIGALYQAVGYHYDAQHFRQRGQSFQVGSALLNLNCLGKGYPTVVLDSGMGGTSLDWIRVQPEVAKFTRVCSYDRAGYGWSDSSLAPRTSLQIAKELDELLISARERGPFVLVGHSFGGYTVRMFTKLYPSSVVGIVLVDSEHYDDGSTQKEWHDALPASIKVQIARRDKQRQLWDRIVEPIKLHLGLDRLVVALGGIHSSSFSKDLQGEVLFLEQQPKYIKAVESEDRFDDQRNAFQIRTSGNFGDRPLIVLTAEKAYAGDPNEDLLTTDQKEARDKIWYQLQAEYAHLSRRGKQMIIRGSSHEMPADRPDAIVAAIKEVGEQLSEHFDQ